MSKTKNWQQELENINQQFVEVCQELNPEQLNTKPNPDKWSIAQVLDHLIKINESYFPTFENLVAGTHSVPFVSKIGILVNMFGNFIYKSVEPQSKKKIMTVHIWEPSQSDLPGNILEQFIEHQLILSNWLYKLEPFVSNRTVISSPANRNVVYTLEKAIGIIIMHERRHFNQAVEVKGAISRLS